MIKKKKKKSKEKPGIELTLVRFDWMLETLIEMETKPIEISGLTESFINSFA